jgi:hypothetical protein
MLDEAIVQFTKVLAVDPGDLSATFRLGKIYQWKGDWKSALDSYRAVYAADPYFENVGSQYNQVARDHADTLGSLGWYLADTQRVWWHAETSFSSQVNSTFGLTGMYQTDSVRIERDDTTGTSQMDHSSYQLHDLSVGVPLKLLNGRLGLTPWVGGVMGANGLFEKFNSTGTAVVNDDRFGVYAVEPYVKLDASFGGWSAVFLNGTMRWGRHPDTWDLLRSSVYDASAEANAFTNLSFIDSWPLKDTTLRTYGRIDYLHTGDFAFNNFLYTALQEITVNVLKGENPYGVLSVNGNVTWQQSQRDEIYLYYAPLNVLQAGGGLTGSMSFGVGGGDVLGLSLRAYAGAYQERISFANHTRRIKTEAEADASLTQGSGTWTLSVTGNATFNLDLSVNPWDYGSVTVRFGYTTKLARLLAP